MVQIQKISKMKFGIIDETYMNNIVDGVNEFNSIKDSLLTLIGQSSKIKSMPFLAEITSAGAMTTVEIERFDSDEEEEVTVAWYYEWKTVTVASADTSSAVTFGAPQTSFTDLDVYTSIGIADSGYGFNLAELANTATYDDDGIIFGVNVQGEGYPPAFIPVGIPEKSVVMLTRLTSNSGQVIYVFDRQGTHDGVCPE
jgi:hypothetical protein